jgi:hypothetical protein
MRTFAKKQDRPQERISSGHSRSHTAVSGAIDHTHPLLRLQRTIGNQAVQRLLQTNTEELEVDSTSAAAPRFAHDFSPTPIPPDARATQTKPALNRAHVGGLAAGVSRATGERGLQRYAFIDEKRIEKSEKDFTSEMQGMVLDTVVRNYTGVDEFKKYAGKETDYLGNLADGTWLRFEPTGLNILGEYHTQVTLKDVVPAVGSKNFISERLSVDDLKEGSNLKAAYEAENQDVFKKFGIEKEKDKKQFGAESLFPKIGFGLNLGLPYFEGKKAMSNLKSGPDKYDGKPVQRYLKIAWAHSKDNKLSVEAMQKAKQSIPPKMEALAKVHTTVEGQLDKFITSLVVDGFIGDELIKKENAALLPPLVTFSQAAIDALVEMAVADKSSRLSDEKRKEYASAKSISEKEQKTLFSNWRNYLFQDNVNDAAKRGVRYAGMGQAHLDYLVKVGLPKNAHAFEMAGKDIKAFDQLTKKLKEAAKKS